MLQDIDKRPTPGRARQLLDAFDDCYTLLADTQGLIRDINEPLSIFLGQDRQLILGNHLIEVFGAYGLNPKPLRFKLALRQPRQWRHNWAGRWFEVRTYPLMTDDGETMLAVMFRDISAQVALEYGLSETRERLDSLTANLPGTIFSLTENGDCVSLHYLSLVRYRSLGFDRADLIENPKLFSEHIIKEDWLRLVDEARLARQQGKPLDSELRLRTPDGRLVWLQVIASARGQFWDGMVFDITRRKWTEEALIDSEQRLSLAMEAASEGLWDLDLVSGAMQCSPRCYAMLGYEPHELKSAARTWLELIHPAERRTVLRQFNRHRKGAIEKFDAEFRMLTKAGSWIWILSRGRIMRRDSAGRPLRCMGTNIDINERKLMEERNRQYEQRLFQRQKLEAIGTLAGGIAHDFNNILSAVVGFTELLQDETPNDPQIKAHLKEILKASERGRGLVNQILGARTQNAGERYPVQVQLIVLETLKLLSASLPENIRLKRDLDRTAAAVMADATHLHQIIMNLLTNALHAMEGSGGTLSVSLKPAQEIADSDCVRLTVTDTGTGMPPETIERIFEPFFSTKPQGTGLGLVTVKSLVAELGGEIRVLSQPQAGSTFIVDLPCLAAEKLRAAPRASNLPRGHGEHVLMVDDEIPIIEVSRQLLERLGYRVTALTDSATALATFKTLHPHIDLVITDQAMPGLNGLELAKALHEIKPGIPVILCTGLSERLPASPLIRQCIFKPVAREDLAQAIRQALKPDSGPKSRPDQL